MKELLISIIVVLLIVIVLMKYKDHFHNYTKDTIPNDSYMNHVIDAILFDLNGRKIISNPIQFNNLNRFRINVSNLIQGFYIIYLVDDSNNEVAIYKMLKD